MTSNGSGDDISLREPQQLNTGEQELNTGDNAEQNVRQRSLDRNRVFALVGSALGYDTWNIWFQVKVISHV